MLKALADKYSEKEIAERYAEYTEIVDRAVSVLGNDREANHWLTSASSDFEGLTPLQNLVKDGPARILDVLGKIEHGVYF